MKRAAAAALSGLALVMIAPACGGDHSRPAAATEGRDDKARLDTAVSYLQKVRETADPTLYVKAQGLLDDLAARAPDDPRILEARGALALAQHRFEDAAQLGQEALRVAPRSPTAYGILVDADNELGRYDAALTATQEMVDARPSLQSYARVSYARELRGDYPGAIEAMQQAVSSAGTTGGENLAYVETLLGQLLLTTHDLAGAQREVDAALRAFPRFAAARALQAQILVARGRPGEAADLLDGLVKVQPLPQYAIALGDALTAAGRSDAATRAYGLVDVISKLFVANGVRLDLETALYDADHHPGPDAVARARRALVARPSTLAHDVLAWNLYRVGKLDEAAAESSRALALGSRDPQERYHAAVLAAVRHDDAAARQHLRIVLAENPRFSARLAPDVERLRQQLGL